jgi:hypothetical protein
MNFGYRKYLRVSYGSLKKELIFLSKALTGWRLS